MRDVTFGEDASLVRTGKVPQVLAVFRGMAMTRFRADGVTNIARGPGAWRLKPGTVFAC